VPDCRGIDFADHATPEIDMIDRTSVISQNALLKAFAGHRG
jgi:hypothetical protein